MKSFLIKYLHFELSMNLCNLGNELFQVYSETGETAVAGLTLNAVKGEVAVLLGHNGAGKSTTFSAISGIIAPTAGKKILAICSTKSSFILFCAVQKFEEQHRMKIVENSTRI